MRLGRQTPSVTLRVHVHVIGDRSVDIADLFEREPKPRDEGACQQRFQQPRSKRPVPCSEPASDLGAACRIRTDDLLFTSALMGLAEVADLVFVADMRLRSLMCEPDSQGVRESS